MRGSALAAAEAVRATELAVGSEAVAPAVRPARTREDRLTVPAVIVLAVARRRAAVVARAAAAA